MEAPKILQQNEQHHHYSDLNSEPKEPKAGLPRHSEHAHADGREVGAPGVLSTGKQVLGRGTGRAALHLRTEGSLTWAAQKDPEGTVHSG